MTDQSLSFPEKYSYTANDFCSPEIKLLLKMSLCWKANVADALSPIKLSAWLECCKAATLQLTNCIPSGQAPKLLYYFKAQHDPVQWFM